MKSIHLQLTEQQAQIIRDSLTMRVDKERKYRTDLKRFHEADRIKNLLQLSESQEDVYARLADTFHRIFVLTKWD
jgi:hypothetical protein